MTPDDNGAPDLRATLGARRPFERDDWLAIAALAALWIAIAAFTNEVTASVLIVVSIAVVIIASAP